LATEVPAEHYTTGPWPDQFDWDALDQDPRVGPDADTVTLPGAVAELPPLLLTVCPVKVCVVEVPAEFVTVSVTV